METGAKRRYLKIEIQCKDYGSTSTHRVKLHRKQEERCSKAPDTNGKYRRVQGAEYRRDGRRKKPLPSYKHMDTRDRIEFFINLTPLQLQNKRVPMPTLYKLGHDQHRRGPQLNGNSSYIFAQCE